MDWYYATDGEQKGPVSKDELIELFQSGSVKGTDLVWNETMSDWIAFRKVPELTPSPAEVSDPVQEEPKATPPAMPVSTTPADRALVEHVPNYLWQSIVALLFCTPTGIAAIIYSVKVQPLLLEGRVEEAKAASKTARLWVNITVIITLISFALGFVIGLLE